MPRFRWLAALVLALGAAACTPGSPAPHRNTGPTASSTAAATASPHPAAPPVRQFAVCHSPRFMVKMIERVSGMTGEHAFFVQLLLGTGRPCSIRGYPSVKFTDAQHRPMAFGLVDGSGQYVTHRVPPWVNLHEGSSLFVVVAKYRCDVRSTRSATTALLRLPGVHQIIPLHIAGDGPFDYCAERPSRIVYVSPVLANEGQFA